MHIAHIGCKGLPAKGGTERVVEAIAVRHAREHEVTVYGSSRVCESGWHEGVRVIALWVPRSKYLAPVWLDIASAVHALWSGSADVIHVHGSENSFVLPLLRWRLPVVTTNHGPAYERAKWGRLAQRLIRSMERGSVVRADAATAVARSDSRALAERYGVQVVHIPNGVDDSIAPDEPGARRLLSELGLNPGGFALFAAARVDPTKGCLTLIEAWRALGSPTPLLIVGDLWHAPGHETQLRTAAKGLDVHFIPRVEDKALVFGLVSAADVFIFPSTVEAMSMMLLEAMALGAPVLASDIAPNTDVLPDDHWVFSAGDSEDLARAYRALKAEPAVDITERCARRVASVRGDYSWDRIADQYLAVYDTVVRTSGKADVPAEPAGPREDRAP